MIKSLGLIKQTRLHKLSISLTSLVKALPALLIALVMISATVVRAEDFEAQIRQLNRENSGLQNRTESLLGEAQDLEAALSSLQEQINQLNAKIRSNQNKMKALKAEIRKNEKEIAKQQRTLGQNIRALYLEGEISTIEMLASSKDLSEFLDKETYRTSVQNKVQDTLDRIKQLREQLETRKSTLNQVIADQKNVQKRLDAQRAEQARILAMNRSQRSRLSNQIEENSEEIGELRRQQAAANAALMSSGTVSHVPDSTGYPWAGVPFPNSMPDPWGMYKRQCVSYTAWKVWKSGRFMPYWGGHGNANQWDDNARAARIPVDGNPRVGDVAVSNNGYYGHVMYVEAVYGDGTIYVSQYNASWSGSYSEARIPVGSLVFIHF